MAASSLHHAIQTKIPDYRKALTEKIYFIPGLSLNIHSKNPRKLVQNLIEKGFKNENEVLIWHDVINNSICRHKSKFYCALSMSDLVEVLKSYQNRIRAVVYCQRNGTPDIFWQWKETNIPVFSIEKDFISLRKQKALKYLLNLKALYQIPVIELKHLNLVLKYENDLSQITPRSRPKRPYKRTRKAINNTLSAANE